MQRRAPHNLIQYPTGAPLGFPIAVTWLDGLGSPIHAAGPHAHGFFALLYGMGGTGTMRCGRKSLPIAPGSLVITAPGEVHDTAGLRGVSRWGLDFTPDAFGAEAAGWLFPRPSCPEWLVFLRRSWDEPQVIEVPDELRADWNRQLSTISHELAERVGYRDPTLFIRHFKRAHGVTPRRWRNGS